LPLILRLTVAATLIEGATAHVFLSPAVGMPTGLAMLEGIIGLLLLVGLASVPAMLIAIALFLFVLIQNGLVLGNLEFLGLAITWLMLGSTKPSVDDLLGLPRTYAPERFAVFAPLVLRVSLGATLIFMALYEKLLNPHVFASVVERYHMSNLVPMTSASWTLSVGLTELLLGLCIALGLHTRLTAALSLFVMSLTFLYFGESLSAHVTLFGSLAALFILGNGPHSLGKWYARRFAKTS
ncbi:MAG: DoxX family membrane protein, partial [Candidatus Uhrbacteria bacterium]|nr:DoxX family membrane protein [Candidatus Uhrbacteria bacterium]